MRKPTITPEQAAQLEEATIKNIVEKIGAGGIPSAREIEMLRKATATPPRHSVDHWREGELAEWLDLSRQRVEQLAEEGTIPAPTADGWPAKKCVVSYIRKLRERLNDEGKADRARREKAEADMAEMESAKMEGTLSDRKQTCFDLRHAIEIGRAGIQRLKTLTSPQKEQVFAILRNVKLPPLPKP